MPASVITRGAAVAAALALGIACVPELNDGAAAAATLPAAAGGASPVTIQAQSATEGVLRRPTAPTRAEYDAILAQSLTGRELLDRRADLVPEVAQRNDVTPAQLAHLLVDPTVTVSPEGHVYVVEHPLEGQAQGQAASGSGSESGAGATPGAVPVLGADTAEADTFALQSRPGASRTIYLDFDGADVTGTVWGSKGVTGSVPGFNQANSDAASFTPAEKTFVRQVWRQVSETYAPFDVNVTTRDPGRDAWFRSNAADTTYGSRVVLTSSVDVQRKLCGGCAGIAGFNTFGKVDEDAFYQPAWVFVTDFARTAPTVVAQTVSHEVGHNLGLKHDGGPDKSGASQEYAFGSNRWGPIMGGGTQRAVSQWSRGEYAGATNQEDDLAVIAQNNLPLVADDHGGTTAAATGLGPRASYDVEGVIGSRDDVDVFAIEVTCTLDLDVRARGIGPQSALDLRLDLLSGNGTQIASDNPVTTHDTQAWDAPTASWKAVGMDAGLTRSLAPGTYYLRVDGTGSGDGSKGDMLGWSDYGSLGRYRVTSNGCDGTTAPPTTPPTTPPATPPTSGPATPPGAPTMGSATSGAKGGRSSLTVRWTAPRSNGGSTITGWTATAYKLNARNAVVKTFVARGVPAQLSAVELLLPKGRYKVALQAVNAAGTSASSATSGIVTAR